MRATLTALTLALAGPAAALDRAAVVETYADIGEAVYGDAHATALDLKAAVDAFLAEPSQGGLEAARAAWVRARVPYQQSEPFRFGNPVVDDWEPRVNSWPLDEGLIDYVDPSYGGVTDENAAAVLNVVANPVLVIDGREMDASRITEALVAAVNEAGGIESNVARGYHAVEFLLWGQDLSGDAPGAGQRPWTDYAQGAGCTHENCERRADFLRSVTDLLVTDLSEMAFDWRQGGAARAVVTADPYAGLRAMLTGMGSLSYGEMAGERMRLGLMLNDPEEEQDCFSDNTATSHLNDGIGLRSVYAGRYERVDGSVVEGPSLSALVAEADPALDAEIAGGLDTTVTALEKVQAAVEGGMAYDMMLRAGNAEGEALISGGVDALIAQTRSFERAVAALGLDGVAFEGSDALDTGADGAVFQ